MNRVFILIVLWLVPAMVALGAQTTIERTRLSSAPEKTRVVLDTSRAPVDHRIFTLSDPERVVIDLDNARLGGSLPRPEREDALLVGLRSGVREQHDLRIVLDLKQGARVKSFVLAPEAGKGHRLVVDLLPRSETKGVSNRASTPRVTVQSVRRGATLLIAIDAGHGGADPGAIGRRGAREKDVTLAIARKLAALIEREAGMRALLIRDGDYYVGLRQRIEKARKHRADLFISIHADAFTNARAHGASVFTLSFNGASSEAARWLADRENRADLIGGYDLRTSDDVLATVLLDMTQNATIEHSTEAAKAVLAKLSSVGSLHQRAVQRAGFAVLKAPDIPSLLVETAFISHPEEERRLTDPVHQQRLADAIFDGVQQYLHKYPPPGLMTASADNPQRHTIHPGDTLSEIAQRYHVSLSSLRTINGLTDDTIRVGQVLKIPSDS